MVTTLKNELQAVRAALIAARAAPTPDLTLVKMLRAQLKRLKGSSEDEPASREADLAVERQEAFDYVRQTAPADMDVDSLNEEIAVLAPLFPQLPDSGPSASDPDQNTIKGKLTSARDDVAASQAVRDRCEMALRYNLGIFRASDPIEAVIVEKLADLASGDPVVVQAAIDWLNSHQHMIAPAPGA